MRTKDFDYELPERLIAQTPLANRSDSKLLIVDKKTGDIEHSKFYRVLEYFNPGDVLVINDTKVLPARMYGVKEQTQAFIEILLLKELEDYQWQCLVKPAKRVRVGTKIDFGEGLLTATCTEEQAEGIRILTFSFKGIFYEILDQLGQMPLPPYIHEQLEDKGRYQTVYAKHVGSAAAPTAGLHFTEELLIAAKEKGISIVPITLHVGLGTFRPVSVDDVHNHKMHSEYYEMDAESATILNQAKQEKRRIISVGTTTTRTLETIMRDYGTFIACSGWTDIFLYPGHQFLAIDALITNFHLPKSTLLMLVSAFATKEYMLKAYQEAIEHEYRFFSFGDAMFIKEDSNEK